MSRPPALSSGGGVAASGHGLPTLLACGALGAAAATAICALWQRAPSSVAAASHIDTTHLQPPPPAVPERRPSGSHSCAWEGSISRIGSDASYLEENTYVARRHSLHEGDEDDDENDEEDEPSIYMCPHCSNYINANELIVPSMDEANEDEDENAEDLHAARVLSAAEALSIQLALKESLQQIFRSVDEDGDGVITREEMGAFLKKLGLTGEREAAFLNIVGGDSVQTVATPASSRTDSDSSVPSSHGAAEKRGSESSVRSSGGGTVVGINFKQFFDRFQDSLEGMDDLSLEAASPEDEAAATITTTQIHLEPETPQLATDAADAPTAAAAADSSATSDATAAASSSSSSSGIFTPPRGTGPSRLTVNTTPSCSPVLGRHRSTPSNSSTGSLLSPALFSPSAAGGGGGGGASIAGASAAIRVFLGGACGDTTWRKTEAIPQLTAAGITFYDPQVKEWSQKLVALEGLMKAWCRILLFVIGSRTRALASMIEVAALIAAGRRVVLVIEPVEGGVEIEGQVPSASELKDLNRAREYLREVAAHHAIPVHPSVDAGIKAIIAMEEEERRERERERHRLAVLREATMGAPGSASRGSISLGSARRGRSSILLSGQNSPLVSPGHKKASSSLLAGLHPPPSMQGHPPQHPNGHASSSSVQSSPHAGPAPPHTPLAATAPPPSLALAAAAALNHNTTSNNERKSKPKN